MLGGGGWKCVQTGIRQEKLKHVAQDDEAGEATVSLRVKNMFSNIYI